MNRHYLVLGLAGILALVLSIPALGEPSNPMADIAARDGKVRNQAKKAKRANKAAQGAGAVEVKTGQKNSKLRIGGVTAKGQLQTRGGSKTARKRCLRNREVELSGPAPTFTPSRAARPAIGATKTNRKGRWSITAPPDMFFADGAYVVRVKAKTLGGAKKGSQIIRCGSNRKKVIR